MNTEKAVNTYGGVTGVPADGRKQAIEEWIYDFVSTQLFAEPQSQMHQKVINEAKLAVLDALDDHSRTEPFYLQRALRNMAEWEIGDSSEAYGPHEGLDFEEVEDRR